MKVAWSSSGLGFKKGPPWAGLVPGRQALPRPPHLDSTAHSVLRCPSPSCPHFPGPCLTRLSSFLLLAASRMITNSLNRDSPPGTPPRRPDTSTSKISVTVSNKMAAKSAKAAGEETRAGGGRSWRPLWVGRRHQGDVFLDAAKCCAGHGVSTVFRLKSGHGPAGGLAFHLCQRGLAPPSSADSWKHLRWCL